MRLIALAAPLLLLCACDLPPQVPPGTGPAGPDASGASAEPAPVSAAPVAPPPPPPQARTVEEFDTTSAAERAAAVAAPPPPSEVSLGRTIVSLGPPADPGIWIETPLVTSPRMGRVDYPDKGTSVALELRPSGGAAGSGSQISLAAMRLLEIPLTALAEVTVYAPGA
jgi:hypothetical protein